MAFNLLLLVLVPDRDRAAVQQLRAAGRRVAEGARAGADGALPASRRKGLFVMDGSKRSAHANAYFTGFGAAKRVVFFDTLLRRLAPGEVEAVLAHELGHFKLQPRHASASPRCSAISLAGFALLGWLVDAGRGSTAASACAPSLARRTTRSRCCCSCSSRRCSAFFVSPLFARLSRRHEFEADAYACAQADGGDLASALLKLHEDNASTLTPDPLYARFYYSHPPAVERLAALVRPLPEPDRHDQFPRTRSASRDGASAMSRRRRSATTWRR